MLHLFEKFFTFNGGDIDLKYGYMEFYSVHLKVDIGEHKAGTRFNQAIFTFQFSGAAELSFYGKALSKEEIQEHEDYWNLSPEEIDEAVNDPIHFIHDAEDYDGAIMELMIK